MNNTTHMKTKLYGASDDLIEIEGAISDEIGCYNDGPISFVASDGTKGKIKYDGDWRIDYVGGEMVDKFIKSVGDEAEHTEPDAKGCSSYSDVLIFKPGLLWLKVGQKNIQVK